jgi:hemin uptake protein HemP
MDWKGRTTMLATVLNASPATHTIRELLTLDSAELFVRGKEVRIRHAGEEYRLRLTSNNKLILTK